nr:hypothetical protein [uncultured Rhodopila sp.]
MPTEDTIDDILEHPIPVLSNRLILGLIERGDLQIDPFQPERLGATSYQICPYRVRFHVEDEDGITLADKIVRLTPGIGRDLRPGEYAVVSPKERIRIAEGFVASFFPSSWCVENQLLLTVGRLDAGYTADLVFGVYNAGISDVRLTAQFQLARVSFGWLGRYNTPVYGGLPPGAYIPQLSKLREREAELNSEAERIREQREEVVRLRKDLESKQGGFK